LDIVFPQEMRLRPGAINVGEIEFARPVTFAIRHIVFWIAHRISLREMTLRH